MTVRQISGSTKFINILHGLEHSASSSTVCKQHSSLAAISTASDNLIIPRNINAKCFTAIVWDNNDFNEATPTGKGTTHAVNGIIIQRGEPALNSNVTMSEKLRTVKPPDHDIQSYTTQRKAYHRFVNTGSNVI